MVNEIVRAAPVDGCQDVILATDLPGFADRCDQVDPRWHEYGGSYSWCGSKAWSLSTSQVRSGDMTGVAPSDKLMTAIEIDDLVTQSWTETLDVVGGTPCVPAFLAGHPLTMRRMERVADERGPLCVFATMTVSAGVSLDTMRKRGAAVLALVRALSAMRPVQLFACVAIGERGWGSHVLIRIDTAPLDIARAAHVLTCPSVTRNLGYGVCSDQAFKLIDKTWYSGWAYSNPEAYRKTSRDNYISVVCPGAESLLIPGAHIKDPCVNDPVTWLKTMISQYGGLTDND
jgi:hypothetical protein